MVLFSKSGNTWDKDTIKQVNEYNPDFDSKYSILFHADSIKDLGIGSTFQVSCMRWKRQKRLYHIKRNLSKSPSYNPFKYCFALLIMLNSAIRTSLYGT